MSLKTVDSSTPVIGYFDYLSSNWQRHTNLFMSQIESFCAVCDGKDISLLLQIDKISAIFTLNNV
jgi:hypothetical protein